MGLIAMSLLGCDATREVVLHRQNCLVCHQPLNSSAQPEGIETAHPWYELSCTDCHGGNGWICDGELVHTEGDPECIGEWVYDEALAHVDPAGSPKYLKDLTPAQLDTVDRDYLRFINPGDLRVVQDTCGRCHTNQTARVKRSMMSHTAGEVTVARFRAGKTSSSRASVGAIAATDLNPASAGVCGRPGVAMFDPPPIDPGATDPLNAPTVANAQDQYLVKTCMHCHLNSFGPNDAPGRYRSSGCTACHMPYANAGRSASADPWVNKQTTPHPISHRLVTAAAIEVCTHCHHEGARIGLNYQGIREALEGPAGELALTLSQPLYGHEGSHFIVDEDTSNDWDETPPDVHFQAGMHCVDCHTKAEVHGDNHIYGNASCVLRVSCTDCHGDVRKRAKLTGAINNLYQVGEEIFLHTKVTGLDLRVPQIKDAITPGNPQHNTRAELAMGFHADGTSHTDKLACQTCHAGWLPSCYGCHVQLDLTKAQAYDTTGVTTPGLPTSHAGWIQLNDLVLMRDAHGKLAPSMPAERLFMTLFRSDGSGNPEITFADAPRTFIDGEGRVMAGFGQRAIDPHTTQRSSPFMACDRCHTVGDPLAPDNAVLLDITHGFGSQRFPFLGRSAACPTCPEETLYQLDAVIDPTGRPLVVVGHDDPIASRPLTLEEIDRMRRVIVTRDPGFSTPIPADAATDPRFPASRPMP